MNRLWIDANVVLRFLTGDPPEQAERSERLMARAEGGEVELVLPLLVVAEVVWVLKSFYRYPFDRIAETLSAFLNADGLAVEDLALVLQALELARDKNVDFTDAVLALQAARQEERVCSFDEDFKRLPANRVVPS